MGLTGISEFTFGFAFLHEQTNRHWAGLTAVPILPSLQQEAGQGWDARLPVNGIPNYYQFKLSDYLHRPNAKYIADGTYTAPYYRFSLHKRNQNEQHRRLRELCLTEPETFYVAPEINDVAVFNTAFLHSGIFNGSRIIRLSDCQDITDGELHHITYQAGDPTWREHSEVKTHEWSFVGKEIDKLFDGQKARLRVVDRSFAESVFERQTSLTLRVLERSPFLVKDIDKRMLEAPQEKTRKGFLEAAAQQAMTFFGATLVIVGEPQEIQD